MKTALVHDWLTGMRGGEYLLESLCDLFPDADIYTLFHFPEHISEKINRHHIHSSWLQSLLLKRTLYRYYLPLFPFAIRSFSLPDSQLVISVSHCVAKGIRKPRNAFHLCICLTPMRYIWRFFDVYFEHKLGLSAQLLQPLRVWLKHWDRRNKHVDHFVAISQTVAQRIHEVYQRESTVIYPPVDTEFFTPGVQEERGEFYLVASALVPYKRIELAIEAFNQLGKPLKIAGAGGELRWLKKEARANVEFLGYVSREHLRRLYCQAKALVFPGEEDFGLTPVEAQACGTPVIAFARGGATESVVPEQTGILFPEQTAQSLMEAVEELEARAFSPAVLRGNSLRFSRTSFIKHFTGLLDRLGIAYSQDKATMAFSTGAD